MLSKKSKRRFGTFEESKTKDAVDSKIFTNSEPPNKIIRVSSTRNNKNLHSTYDALNSMSSPSTSRDSVKMVTCVLLNNFHLEVPFDVMTHCETFNEAQKFSNYINNPNLFEMKLIDVDAFRKIIEYIQKTKGNKIIKNKTISLFFKVPVKAITLNDMLFDRFYSNQITYYLIEFIKNLVN